MKNKKTKDAEFEEWFKDLKSQIDDWSEIMDELNSYVEPFHFISLPYKKLNFLRAKGLVTFTFSEMGISDINLTDKGITYFEDKRLELKKWMIRDVLIGIFSSILTAIITTLITYWIIGR